MVKKEKEETKQTIDKGIISTGSASKISDTDKKLDSVLTGINTLAGAIEKLIEINTPKTIEEKFPIQEVKTKFNPKLDDESYPEEYIPPKFRAIVDEILSDEFGLKIVDFDDRTDMQINIIVPDKYSSVSKNDRAKGVEDIRSRIIPRSLGENGIREWCKIIRVNLNKFYSQEGVRSPFTS